jgi:hypothetical protein
MVTYSKQSVDIGRGDFRGPNEDNQKCQRDNEKERPDHTVRKAIAHNIASQNPSIIEPSHPFAFSKFA